MKWFEHKTTDDPLRQIVSKDERIQTYRIYAKLECGHMTTYTRAANTPDKKKAVHCYHCRPRREAE